ncbi:MAG: hypothetical protein QME07_03215 [bacterium]|nr:hypothetical protein [bacterium]
MIKDMVSIWKEEEREVEKRICFGRMGIGLLCMVITVLFGHEFPPSATRVIPSASIILFLYSAVIIWVINKGFYQPYLKYLSTTLDILLLSATIFLFGSFHTFKTAGFLVYFILVFLAGMRYSAKIPIYTGFLASIIYILMLVYSSFSGQIQIGTMLEEHTSSKVSPVQQILNLLFLIFASFVSYHVAEGYRRLIDRIVKSEVKNTITNMEKGGIIKRFISNLSEELQETLLDKDRTQHSQNLSFVLLDLRDMVKYLEEDADYGQGLLERFIDGITRTVFDYNGQIKIGEKGRILIIFKEKILSNNDVKAAILTSLKIKARLSRLNIQSELEKKRVIEMPIFLHSAGIKTTRGEGLSYPTIKDSISFLFMLSERVESGFEKEIVMSSAIYNLARDVIDAEEKGEGLYCLIGLK